MGYLENKMVYLSGPIQYAQDIEWRSEPIRILQEKFGLIVFDPYADPKQKWTPVIQKAQKEKDYSTIVSVAKKFVRKDLGKLDKSDFLIAYLSHNIPTTGVCHEVINSNNEKKPTLLVTNSGDIANIPIWYYGFISLEFMFPNWNNLFNYLEEVDSGKHKHNNRWSLVYEDI